ncbi:MAG TPA: hypothetical protein VGD87_10140 [Archangium sp.]
MTVPLQPTPTSLEGPLRSERDVAQHRRLYCSHYEKCLDRSVAEGWDGFTCTHCPLQAIADEGPGSLPYARARDSAKL